MFCVDNRSFPAPSASVNRSSITFARHIGAHLDASLRPDIPTRRHAGRRRRGHRRRVACRRIIIGRIAVLERNQQILAGHQTVFGDELRETIAQMTFALELVERVAMMEIGVREDAIDATAHGAQLGHGRLLDGDAEADESLIKKK